MRGPLALMVACTVLLSGCGTMKYLIQAGKGQLALINRARPIQEVVRDERTPTRLRELLSEIEPIKKYGENQGIRPTKNYTDYVRLDRRAAVWVVSACDPLRFEPKEWRFPIVGGFPYLGWFDLEDARQYAAGLKAEGFDVDLRGAAAYSTLGWFRDAVLSSMIPEGKEALPELVNVILHESVHATVYVKGQAYFNEGLASFVAGRLTVDYLKKTRGEHALEIEAYLKLEKDGKERAHQMHETYVKLEALYASPRTEAEKRAEKSRLLAELRERTKYPRDINNATLIQYKEYSEGGAKYEELLASCQGDWNRFLKVLGRLRPDSFAKPQQEEVDSVILPIARAGCI